MKKPKLYTGQPLEGVWEVTLKLDGVRMLRGPDGSPVSRSGKPLNNLAHVSEAITDAEVFFKDWDTTVSLVRTKSHREVKEEWVYSLDPLDPRLFLGSVEDPSEDTIHSLMEKQVEEGYEGIVLRQGGQWFKVKPEETFDVVVTGVALGKGKYQGMVGALITPMGRVSGMNDACRRDWVDGSIVGKTVEVACMSLTKSGKFRHPRLKRVRWDKGD
tara:strand:- start:25279 stop:25923 length:645 start_codon:yes stop_codon:yes gene_type:complete